MNNTLQISLSTDTDGFVSQECPSCKEVFKVKFGSGAKAPISHCPYCPHSGQQCWWTEEQATYLKSQVRSEVIDPALEKMATDLKRSSRGGFIKLSMKVNRHIPSPRPLESNLPMPFHHFECCGETIKYNSVRSIRNCIICGNATQGVDEHKADKETD